MKTFNAAIIGCGTIFSNHADAISRLKNVKLIAVCDIDVEKAKEASLKYGCEYVTDYRDILIDDKINVVHICTPHYLHAQMVTESLYSRKNVLCEKPMAMTEEEGKRIIEAVSDTKKAFGVCFQNRYSSTCLETKRLLNSGKAGRILGAKAMLTWNKVEDYYIKSDWRGKISKEGGGVLINQAIHMLDLLQWFLGDITSVRGSTHTRLLEGVIEVEDTAEATLTFEGGHTAIFYATNCYPINSPHEIEILCENATIKLSDMLIVTYKDGSVDIVERNDVATGGKYYWGLGHNDLIEDFYTKLANGQKFEIDEYEGIKTLKILKEIYKR